MDMSCDNKELIVSYLYDDLSEIERREFDAHLSLCGACREEVVGLRATRNHLSLWSPPEPEFAFRIIREPVAAAKVLPMRSRWVPAFGLAAAAALVIAVASAIANLEIRYNDATGLVVRTGWSRGDSQLAGNGGSNGSVVPAGASSDYQALDRRLQLLETTLAAQPAGDSQSASGRMTDAELLRRVREIVTDAEARQQTALTQRLLRVVADFDRQRNADLVAIQRGLGTYQQLTNAELAQQRDVVNQLYRVAVRQEK
jgi:hypothetical protein